jgi:uncharacterized repeat protein (TIGR01451 family)
MKTARPLLCLATALAAFLIAPEASQAASIVLSRSPAPPSAVANDGTQSLTYSYGITFTTTPVKVVTEILGPSGNPVAGTVEEKAIPGATSPYDSAPEQYKVPNGLAPGRYLARVAYYSEQFCTEHPGCVGPEADEEYEAEAQAQFDVTQATGNIIVQKFEDVNGDGIREGNEPGVPDWPFQVVAPNPDFIGTTTYEEATSGDGSFTLSGVPAGPSAFYTVSEILPNPNPLNWASITPASQTVTLGTGQTDALQFGNARLTSLCGSVYVDANHSGSFQGQPELGGVSITLSGTTGTGSSVSAQKATNSQGAYCFDNLYPGTYSVSEGALPSPYQAENDSDGRSNGPAYINPIAVTSGQPSEDNNFLVVAPVISPPPPAPAKLCLTKTANRKKARQGSVVVWKLTVRDCGTVAAQQVSITDPLMGDITLSSAGRGALVRGQIIWAVGTLQPGQSVSREFTTRFDTNASLGAHVNHASADAANAPEVKAQATVRIVPIPHKPISVHVTG